LKISVENDKSMGKKWSLDGPVGVDGVETLELGK